MTAYNIVRPAETVKFNINTTFRLKRDEKLIYLIHTYIMSW